MAHFAPPMQQMYDPTMIGAQAYMPAMQQQQMAMQMQQQQHAAAAATQPHPPAAHSHSGGGSSSKSKDSDKKGRKPYTITKPRESWTKEEHQLFLDALQLYETHAQPGASMHARQQRPTGGQARSANWLIVLCISTVVPALTADTSATGSALVNTSRPRASSRFDRTHRNISFDSQRSV